MNSNKSEQLELGTQAFRTHSHNRNSKIEIRKSRIASLWFAQMRHLVDTAPDWPARPVQPQLIPARTIITADPAHQFAE